jgi:Zn-dependent M32 family carboxypeptidase
MEKLKTTLKRIKNIESSIGLLQWDQQTNLCKNGHEYR